MSEHMEDDVVGKAYDGRLMRRLLAYLTPYWRSVLVALAAIVVNAVLQLAPPYLTKLAIDEHIATGNLQGLATIAWLYVAVLVGSFACEYVQTWLMQLTGSASCTTCGCRFTPTCRSSTCASTIVIRSVA
jgi:ATP-binding cassette subfamily B multidrug efflux pump